MRLKLFLSVLFIFVFFSTASALVIQLEAVDSIVEPGEKATFKLEIFNNGNDTKYLTSLYMISFFTISSDVFNYELPAGNSTVFDINISVPYTTNIGKYITSMFLVYSDDLLGTNRIVEDITTIFNVYVPLTTYIEVSEFNYPTQIDPRDAFETVVKLSNSYRDVSATLTTEFYFGDTKFKEEAQEFDLILGEYDYDFDFKLSDYSAPGAYSVAIKIEVLGEAIYEDTKYFEVLPYTDIIIEKQVSKSIFGKKVSINIYNNGTENVDLFTVSNDIGFFDRILMTSATQGKSKSDREISWNATGLSAVDYNPVTGGAVVYPASFVYRVTYIPLIVTPFIIAACIFATSVWFRRVTINKKVIDSYMKDGVMESRVIVKVKNVSFSPIQNIKVIEKVPGFASSVSDFGSLRGSLVIGKDNRKKLIWNLTEINPGDEIMLSYKIKSKIELEGSVYLPPTKVVFTDKKKKFFERKSNVVSFTTESRTIK